MARRERVVCAKTVGVRVVGFDGEIGGRIAGGGGAIFGVTRVLEVCWVGVGGVGKWCFGRSSRG